MTPIFALGWTPGSLTGWGTFGVGLARSLHAAGYDVRLPAGADMAGVLPLDRPLIQSLVQPMPESGDVWLFVPLGNDLGPKPELPPHIKVCALCVFEDAGALDAAAVERLRAYDQLIAPSRWVQSLLAAKGLEAPVCHQGYDGRVFFPAPSRGLAGWRTAIPDPDGGYVYVESSKVPRSTVTRPCVFSGGKLEFRKGQDIVVEAFRRFRATPEGKDAVLVVAWDNPWPKTMDGIWLSGYVKGIPTVTNGKADIVGWLEVNGIPRNAVIDCGRLSPPEMAQVMRSCTVGVFPSRCEGATNLVLVEALATGLPCVVSFGHGHADLKMAAYPAAKSLERIPTGSRLYRSGDGWTEADPEHIAWLLQHVTPTVVPQEMRSYWDWMVRGPAFAEACLSSPVPA